MKHFSFVYFSMLLHDSEEGCSHFVLQELLTLVELTVPCPPIPNTLFSCSFLWQSGCKDALKPLFSFSFCKAEGSSTVDWVIKMKSHPHWFILTHRCRTFELRWVSTVPPTGLLSSAKLGQVFEYSWSSMTTSRYSVSGPMLIPGFAHLSPLETLYLSYQRFGVLWESVRWLQHVWKENI